jgi:circadian clock protein KaiB
MAVPSKKNRTLAPNAAFEKSLLKEPRGKCVLKLYVAGATDRSRQAVVRARMLCEAEFGEKFKLEVIDVYQQPILARNGQIVATPTLVREFPRPVRKLIGNLVNTSGFFVGLEMDSRGEKAP